MDVKYTLPWGVITGKTWNDPCGSPLLFLHGLQDNAGSFDRLIPLLPSTYYCVVLDLPGHGYSSQIPSIGPLNFFDYVYAIKQVLHILEWERFAIIAHSFGGMVGKTLASLYPERITHLLVIDMLSPKWMSIKSFPSDMANRFDSYYKIANKIMKKTRPVYTYNEAFDKLTGNRPNLNKESAKHMLDRHLIKTDKGYCFTLDPRLTQIMNTSSLDQIINILNNIQCPYIILVAESSRNITITNSSQQIIDNLKKKKNFQFKYVNGDHDIHMNKPEIICQEIVEFLKIPSKL